MVEAAFGWAHSEGTVVKTITEAAAPTIGEVNLNNKAGAGFQATEEVVFKSSGAPVDSIADMASVFMSIAERGRKVTDQLIRTSPQVAARNMAVREDEAAARMDEVAARCAGMTALEGETAAYTNEAATGAITQQKEGLARTQFVEEKSELSMGRGAAEQTQQEQFVSSTTAVSNVGAPIQLAGPGAIRQTVGPPLARKSLDVPTPVPPRIAPKVKLGMIQAVTQVPQRASLPRQPTSSSAETFVPRVSGDVLGKTPLNRSTATLPRELVLNNKTGAALQGSQGNQLPVKRPLLSAASSSAASARLRSASIAIPSGSISRALPEAPDGRWGSLDGTPES